MNTLFITHHYLSSNGGGSFASRAYINAFAQLSSNMTLLYPVKDGEDLFNGINPDIETVAVEYNVSKLQKFIHLLSGKVHRYFRIARKISDERSFDIVVFDTSVVSYKLIDTFKDAGCKIMVIHHNYQYEYFRDNTQFWLKISTLFWCKRYEGEAVRKADLNLTLTNKDIKLLSERYNSGDSSNFRLLGVFEDRSFPSGIQKFSSTHGHRFVITGNLSAPQTRNSLIPWIRDYYPILKAEIPDASLTIAGKQPGEEITALCLKEGIQLIPSPISMDSVMENADYYICPVCMGGGIKLRVMDGLKWGLPVIAHAVSARGYDTFIDRGFILPYSSICEFREGIVKLVKITSCRNTIYKAYCDAFSFHSGVERLKTILIS